MTKLKFLILFALIVSVFVFNPIKAKAATYTAQPSTKDNFVNSADSDANWGVTIRGSINGASTHKYRILQTFDVSGYTAGSAAITSAKLNLYYYAYGLNDPKGKSVDVYKQTRSDWTEGTQDGTTGVSSWDQYKASTAWTTAGGDYVTSNPVGGNTSMPASYGWVEWDITAIVKDAIDNNSSIVNLLVKYNNENEAAYPDGYFEADFYSSEYTTDTTKCPKLVITSAKRRIFISLENTLMSESKI